MSAKPSSADRSAVLPRSVFQFLAIINFLVNTSFLLERLRKTCGMLLFWLLGTTVEAQDKICEHRSSDGRYSLSWMLNPASQLVDFSLRVEMNRPDFWTGFAIGGGMTDGDSILLLVENGQLLGLEDGHLSGYNRPTPDSSTDVKDLRGEYRDGVLSATFSRAVDTGDEHDKPLAGCIQLMIPESGGPLFGRNIGKHQLPPVVITTCMERCVGAGEGSPPTDTEVAPLEPPPGCQFESEGYALSWLYTPDHSEVEFTLMTRSRGNDWTGVGFGKEMANGDMVVIVNQNGRLTLTDRHSKGYRQPAMDADQSVTYLAGTVDSDRVVAVFTKPMISADPDDFSLEDFEMSGPNGPERCQYFQFPVGGGYASDQNNISRHSKNPLVKVVCGISRCTANGAGGRVLDISSEESDEEEPAPAAVLCSANHSDHHLCTNYFQEYLQNVTNWALQNSLTPESQFPRACGLLESTQNGLVKEVCCKEFSRRCSSLLNS